jgi:hypothetical protein
MPPVRGLAIIVATADPTRFETALTLAASWAALGGRTRILLDRAAVRLAGLGQQEGLETCFDLGTTVTLCQSGLAEAGLEASTLDVRFAYGGMVGFMADLDGDRLVVA